MQDLKNKVAYVTGGTKGIGYGIAEALVTQGVHVGITGRTAETVKEAADRLMKNSPTGARVIGLEADVRDADAQHAAVKRIVDELGSLDIVIANAGIGHFAPIDELTAEQFQETVDVNLTGVFHTVKAALPALKNSEGYLFTIASLAGTNFFAKGAAYNASKFGLVGFTQAVMLDVRQDGIKVTTIMPGSVATHFNDHEPGPDDAWKIQSEDLGQLVVDLLKMPARTLPSKVEVRPSMPPK